MIRTTKFSYFLLTPFIFALFPSLALLSANLGQVGLEKVWLPIVQSIAACAVFWLLSFLLTKNSEISSFAVLVLQFGFFSYGHIYDLIEGSSISGLVIGRHRFLFIFWIVILAVALFFIFRAKRIPSSLKQYLFVFSILLVVYSLGKTAVSIFRTQQAVVTSPEAAIQTSIHPTVMGYKPDIYYIILDTYTRHDVLLDEYGYDNSDFITFLREHGFYVADCAKANYNQTNLSLYLSLNMDYIADPAQFEVISLGRGIRENAARTQLKTLGYQTVAFETGYNFSEWFDADKYFLPTSSALGTQSILSKLGSFDVLFLRSTMLAPMIDASIQQTNDAESSYRRSVTHFTLAKLKEIPQINGPKLVFVHLSMNHAPFVFDPSGGPNNEMARLKSPKTVGDAYYKGYRGTFPYTDLKIEEVVQAIQENSAQKPIIVLQGDHGPLSAKTTKHYEILNALYLPGVDQKDLYPTMSPVNTFRIILDKYFGYDYPLLPDEAYYSHPGKSAYRTPITCP